MSVAEIRKALTPIVTGGLSWAAFIVHSASGPITADEWLLGASILATSVGVYAITNGPKPDPSPPGDVTTAP